MRVDELKWEDAAQKGWVTAWAYGAQIYKATEGFTRQCGKWFPAGQYVVHDHPYYYGCDGDTPLDDLMLQCALFEIKKRREESNPEK